MWAGSSWSFQSRADLSLPRAETEGTSPSCLLPVPELHSRGPTARPGLPGAPAPRPAPLPGAAAGEDPEHGEPDCPGGTTGHQGQRGGPGTARGGDSPSATAPVLIRGKEEGQSSSTEHNSRWEQPCRGVVTSGRSHHHQPQHQWHQGCLLVLRESGGMESQERSPELPGSGTGSPHPLPTLQPLLCSVSHLPLRD